MFILRDTPLQTPPSGQQSHTLYLVVNKMARWWINCVDLENSDYSQTLWTTMITHQPWMTMVKHTWSDWAIRGWPVTRSRQEQQFFTCCWVSHTKTLEESHPMFIRNYNFCCQKVLFCKSLFYFGPLTTRKSSFIYCMLPLKLLQKLQKCVAMATNLRVV